MSVDGYEVVAQFYGAKIFYPGVYFPTFTLLYNSYFICVDAHCFI